MSQKISLDNLPEDGAAESATPMPPAPRANAQDTNATCPCRPAAQPGMIHIRPRIELAPQPQKPAATVAIPKIQVPNNLRDCSDLLARLNREIPESTEAQKRAKNSALAPLREQWFRLQNGQEAPTNARLRPVELHPKIQSKIAEILH